MKPTGNIRLRLALTLSGGGSGIRTHGNGLPPHIWMLAEGVGFEPTEALQLRCFSRALQYNHSATLPRATSYFTAFRDTNSDRPRENQVSRRGPGRERCQPLRPGSR